MGKQYISIHLPTWTKNIETKTQWRLTEVLDQEDDWVCCAWKCFVRRHQALYTAIR